MINLNLLDQLIGFDEVAVQRRLIEISIEMTATRMTHHAPGSIVFEELKSKRDNLRVALARIDDTISDAFLSNGSIN